MVLRAVLEKSLYCIVLIRVDWREWGAYLPFYVGFYV